MKVLELRSSMATQPTHLSLPWRRCFTFLLARTCLRGLTFCSGLPAIHSDITEISWVLDIIFILFFGSTWNWNDTGWSHHLLSLVFPHTLLRIATGETLSHTPTDPFSKLWGHAVQSQKILTNDLKLSNPDDMLLMQIMSAFLFFSSQWSSAEQLCYAKCYIQTGSHTVNITEMF